MIIKPITAVIEIMLAKYDLSEVGNYSLKNGYIWISFINNLSISLSLYSLVLFYIATHEKLSPHRPVIKFLCVKSMIFFTYWQSCLFNLLQSLGIIQHVTAVWVLNTLICGELVLAAVAQAIAFSYKDFSEAENQRRFKNFFVAMGHAVRVDDVI